MTEEDAESWIVERFGNTKAELLAQFVTLIEAEAPHQNLVSAASLQSIWVRHIVDSAQLLAFVSRPGLWIDVGTGAGFPGIVTAVLSDRETLLVEPRRRRVEFLQAVIDSLGISANTKVIQARVASVETHASIVSARAVSSIETLFAGAALCTDKQTQWLLPKGRAAREEVAQAKKSWHGTFHVEQSITDPESLIVVASGVARR